MEMGMAGIFPGWPPLIRYSKNTWQPMVVQ